MAEQHPGSTPGSSQSRRKQRDRRGHGMRGPAFLPGPHAAEGVPARIFGAERFDRLALEVLQDVVDGWPELAELELAVEEVPVLPTHWAEATVPLSSYVEARAGHPARLVLFRRPIEHRAPTRIELDALLLTVIVEQLADVLAVPPEDLHPGYDAD